MKRIRINSVSEIDWNNPAVVKLMAKAYAVVLKDKDTQGSKCK